MSAFTVNTQQRGPYLSIVISVMRPQSGDNEYETSRINVNDLAVVTAKLKPKKNSQCLQLVVGLSKSEPASNLTVLVNITSAETLKHFSCQDEWAEVLIQEYYPDHQVYCGFDCQRRYYLYAVKIDITTHAIKPVTAATSNQLYEDTELTDFKLQATDGVVAFHKNVLFVQSEMFRTMLRGQWKETSEDSISMGGESVQTLQHLKDYMYLGTLPDEGLEQLLLLGRRCLMDNLVAACINKLVTTVKPETFDGLVGLACKENIPELMRALVLGIPDNVVNGIQRLGSKN